MGSIKFYKTVEEALKISVARKYSRGWDREKHKHLFGDQNRIYLPFPEGEYGIEIPEKIENIKKYLLEFQYSNFNIKTGTVEDSHGRQIRIGRVLNKLISNYERSKKRAEEEGRTETPYVNMIEKLREDAAVWEQFRTEFGAGVKKGSDYLIVLSRHPYDIAGMSTDRTWTSCQNLGAKAVPGEKPKRCNSSDLNRYVAADIKAGTFVSYLIRKNDKNIKEPLARLLVKPFYNYNCPELRNAVEQTIKYNVPMVGQPDKSVLIVSDGNRKIYGIMAIPDSVDPINQKTIEVINDFIKDKGFSIHKRFEVNYARNFVPDGEFRSDDGRMALSDEGEVYGYMMDRDKNNDLLLWNEKDETYEYRITNIDVTKDILYISTERYDDELDEINFPNVEAKDIVGKKKSFILRMIINNFEHASADFLTGKNEEEFIEELKTYYIEKVMDDFNYTSDRINFSSDEKGNVTYTVNTGDWSELSDGFVFYHNKQFIEEILSGDWMPDIDWLPDIDDIISYNDIDKDNIELIEKILDEKYKENDKDWREEYDDWKEAIKSNDDESEGIRDAVRFAYSGAQEVAIRDAFYEEAIDKITDVMGVPSNSENGLTFQFNIFDFMVMDIILRRDYPPDLLGENGIEFRNPNFDVAENHATVEDETFNEELQYRLGDI